MMAKVLIGQLRGFRMQATDEGCECASYKKQPKLKCLWSFCRFEQDPFCAFMLSISIRSGGNYLKRHVAFWLFPFPGSPFTVGGLLLCSYFLSLRQHSCWLGRCLKSNAVVMTFGRLLRRGSILTAHERFIDSHMDQTTFAWVFLVDPRIPPQALNTSQMSGHWFPEHYRNGCLRARNRELAKRNL